MRGTRSVSGELWRFGVWFLVPALALAAIAEEVGDGERLRLDVVLAPLRHTGLEPLRVLLGMFTMIGGGVGLTAVAAIPVGYLLFKRRFGSSAFIAVALGGAWAMDRIMKITFGRPRPHATTPLPAGLKPALAVVLLIALAAAWPTRWRPVAFCAVIAFAALSAIDGIISVATPLKSGFDSFPSGHAVGSMTFAASMVIVTWRTRWRWEVVAAGFVYVLVVGISRLYFGFHFASDILGGWCLAVALVALLSRPFRSRMELEAALRP